MRKKDREITDFEEITEIIKRCDACRLALNADGFPYIVPLNFGIGEAVVTGAKLTLYFHSALEGHKIDLIMRDSRASFEMDCSHELQYFEDKGYCTMAYESITGRGHIRILDDDEKIPALKTIMDHYHPGMDAYFNPAALPRTLVYALDVEELTGKRKLRK